MEDFYSCDEVYRIVTEVTEDMENFIFKTIQPWCEEQVERKVSKKDLENALKRYYYKQDTIDVLKEVAKYIKCYIIMPDQEEQKLLNFIDKKIREIKHENKI